MNHRIKNHIKTQLKSIYLKAKEEYKFLSRTNAFKKRYKNVDNKLFINELDDAVIEKYKLRWKSFDKKIEVDTFFLCYNLSKNIDYDIVPENIFAAIIEPKLNKYSEKQLSFLSVKNVYEKWFLDSKIFPKSYFHKIDNIYYDQKFEIINDINAFLRSDSVSYPLICKPSLGTGGGEGVILINNIEEMKESLNSYENLVYQEFILQNEFINNINPRMNSIRTCLYRNDQGVFKVLNNSIRFGVNGGLDNETAGGIVCNIKENGMLNEYAVTKYCEKYTEHPNSKVVFSGICIPFYDKLNEMAELIANEIPLCNLISLDMCLDIDNNWRCIEINLNSQTIRFSQYAGSGFFGKYTDEVINKVLSR